MTEADGVGEKIVDGFRFLPPGLKAWTKTFIPDEEFKGYIPWTPIPKPLGQMTFLLVTSSGISLKSDPPFDMEREKRTPPGEIGLIELFQEGPPRGTSMSIISILTRTISRRIST